MIRWPTILTLALCFVAARGAVQAQQLPGWEMDALNDQGWAEYDEQTHLFKGTNGVFFRAAGAVGTADQVAINVETGDVIADGMVRIQRDDQMWASEHLRYNINTRQMEAQQFRTGKPPIFATGHGLHGEVTNRVFLATNAFVTVDDIDNPAVRIRAQHMRILPGQKIEASHATLWIGDVPVFYFPYYTRNLGRRANNFNFIPGYRTSYGPFILGSYVFFLNEQLDGIIHTDYREKRGFGGGPDLNYHFGQWGQGSLKYYYLYDQDPNATITNSIPNNRQRVNFTYQATPATNLTVKSIVRWQSDPYVVKEFFEGEYRRDPQPNTYVDVNKYWQNFSVDLNVQPRLNDFLETIEQLPDVRLSAFRQQLGPTPFYYESESSVGYYRHLFPVTNGPTPIGLEYEASRFDSYHQLLMPETFFGWLNVIPHVGGRFTYYSQASGPGATTDEVYRGVLDTGAQVNFKASRLWPDAENKLLDVDGLRHIVEPRVEYMYVPTPNAVGTNVIPQFTYQLPSLRLLPIDYPDYNSIDSITSQNVVRFGLRNKLQTKRDGQVANLLNWDVYTDWNLRPLSNKAVAQDGLSLPPQTTFSDVFSDFTIKPRSWLTLESLTSYNLDPRQFFSSLTTVTFEPNQVWSWSLGQYYIANDPSTSPTSLGPGNNLFASTFYYRLNENWGLRAAHRYNFNDRIMEEQDYAIYRDLRSWTAAITLRLRKSEGSPNDFTAALTFSLKAFPRFGLGTDALRPAWLLGS